MSVDSQTTYLLIGTSAEFNTHWHQRLRQSEKRRHFLIDLSKGAEKSDSLPEPVTIIPYQSDLVAALLPFYQYFSSETLEIGTLSETNTQALEVMQALPQALEALQYFKLRADYSEYATNAFLNLFDLIQPEAAFLQRFGFDFFAETIQWAQQLEQQPGDEGLLYRYFRSLFEAYSQTMERLIPLMQQVQKKGRFLLAELEADGDFEQLARLWLETNKPHRFLPWQQKEKPSVETLAESHPELYRELHHRLAVQQAEQLALSKQTFELLSQNLHKIQAIN